MMLLMYSTIAGWSEGSRLFKHGHIWLLMGDVYDTTVVYQCSGVRDKLAVLLVSRKRNLRTVLSEWIYALQNSGSGISAK